MNRFFPLSLAVLATSTLLAGTAVVAQPAQEPRVVTRADAETRAAEAFARLDVNSDGQLSQADRDAHARTRFDAADTDSNGQLSFAEASAMHEQRREMRSERREERGGARMERMGFGPMHGPGPMRGARLEAADTDDNGTVSQAEFTAHALTRFDAADADNNGTVTRDEMRDMRESHRGEGRGRGFRQG